MRGTVVIVGSSVAGVRAAQALRNEGHGGRIILVGAEPELPYDKPPLTKQLLSGTWTTQKLALLTEAEALTLDIELRLGVAAQHLDLAERRVLLADGSDVSYHTCLIATGASARPSPWRAASGVHVVRTLADSRALRADLRRGGPVVVVGGGFIGSEVASTALQHGCAVTMVDPLEVPMGRPLGPEVGQYFTDLHRRHGVATRFGVGVQTITGEAGDLRVVLTDGHTLPAATVVVGIGAVPNDAWLASSGLLLDNGVVCDEYGRAVGRPDVFAAGDVARWFHPRHHEHVRVEHWTNAVDQAVCAAHNITHPQDLRSHSGVEYVWSDQYDWKIQIVGTPPRASGHSTIGHFSGASARGAVLYHDAADSLCGAVTVNWPRALVECRRLVATDTPVEVALGRVGRLAAKPVPAAGAAS
ncbi:NAD(P)/FAD-dependent oxidoreductase [Streptomyces sp. NPDC059256]|uniref:NAD(P)/FAD-dependent oxidoreductase n=1 Tax=Streptomyces sp. NPDC059256 TaxID=3346794 RepID=UPI0036A4519C